MTFLTSGQTLQFDKANIDNIHYVRRYFAMHISMKIIENYSNSMADSYVSQKIEFSTEIHDYVFLLLFLTIDVDIIFITILPLPVQS